jgi:hypothetical protein
LADLDDPEALQRSDESAVQSGLHTALAEDVFDTE